MIRFKELLGAVAIFPEVIEETAASGKPLINNILLRTGSAIASHSEAAFSFQSPRPLQRLVEQGGKSR